MPPQRPTEEPARGQRVILALVRYAIPALLAVLGVVLLIVGHGRTSAAGAGVVLLGVALMVVLINWLARMSIASNVDREREEEAREFFTAHGYWPGERPRDGGARDEGRGRGAGSGRTP